MATLTEILADKKEQGSKYITENFGVETLNVMGKAVENLTIDGIENRAFSVGESIGDATLLNAKSEEVSLGELLAGKPAILNFYRGSWCPYCNLELRYYNELIQADKSIHMIAISPEKPEASTNNPEELQFEVLSDIDNNFARSLNLVFDVTEELATLYKDKMGIDLEKSQGNNRKELPLPATYVVDGQGKITYAYTKADYTDRAGPQEVITAYKKLME